MNRIFALAAFLAVATGCSELDPFLPKVGFKEFQVQNIDFEQANVDFVFAIDNPNPVSIPLASFDYALGFEEQQIISGDNPDGFVIEASDSSDVTLPVDIRWEDAWKLVQAVKGKDEIGFGLDGKMGFDIPELGEVKLPYETGGDFPAVRTPKFTLKSFKAEPLQFPPTTARLNLEMGIDNEHASTLFFDAFDYDIQLEGTSVAKGNVATLAAVDGATSASIDLPIEIDLLAVGITLADAIINGDKVDLGLDATMMVQVPFLDQTLPLHIDETGNLNIDY